MFRKAEKYCGCPACGVPARFPGSLQALSCHRTDLVLEVKLSLRLAKSVICCFVCMDTQFDPGSNFALFSSVTKEAVLKEGCLNCPDILNLHLKVHFAFSLPLRVPSVWSCYLLCEQLHSSVVFKCMASFK